MADLPFVPFDVFDWLARVLPGIFCESRIFRIDHYLGKETVQNIIAFRFSNALFEPIWDRRYVDHVQIAVAESVSIEPRGDYYDHAGALRDMVQNHLMQLDASAIYSAVTWGLAAANELLTKDGRNWLLPTSVEKMQKAG